MPLKLLCKKTEPQDRDDRMKNGDNDVLRTKLLELRT